MPKGYQHVGLGWTRHHVSIPVLQRRHYLQFGDDFTFLLFHGDAHARAFLAVGAVYLLHSSFLFFHVLVALPRN